MYVITDARISTACYDSPGLGCTEHRLSCSSTLVLYLTNITFGYGRGCNAVGVYDCINTTCCSEQPGDCFTPYNQTLLEQLQQTCDGKSSCTLNKYQLNDKSSFCGPGSLVYHSYSKIEYNCGERGKCNISSTPIIRCMFC